MNPKRAAHYFLTLLPALLAIPAAGEVTAIDASAGEAGWSVYFPVHMPGLELTQPVEDVVDVEIDADMIDLAKHANSFFALGVGYRFRALNRQMWLDLNGWHGGYDMDMDDITAETDVAPPPILEEFLDVNVDMQQRIVQGEWGAFLVEDWHRLDLGLITGFRYYDQTIKVFGEIPAWNSDCGLFGCFESQPFRAKEETSWTEFILGFTAAYQWHERNRVIAAFSWGHEESTRLQLINTFSFRESWFASLGWRRDEFVNDGVEIIESGLYFDIGKHFH